MCVFVCVCVCVCKTVCAKQCVEQQVALWAHGYCERCLLIRFLFCFLSCLVFPRPHIVFPNTAIPHHFLHKHTHSHAHCART